MNKSPQEKAKELLKDFIEEFFPYEELKYVGFYDKDIKKTDYYAQSKRICEFFGMKTIYEYRYTPITAHISYAKGYKPNNEGFLTHFPSIYD